MRVPLAIALAFGIVTLAGCNKPRDTGETGAAGGMTTDTTVTTRETQDTALISHDTTVNVDTTLKKGDKTTGVDTTKQTSPGAYDSAR